MVIGTKMKEHKDISIKEDLVVYKKVKYVYIPLICGNDTNVSLKINIGDSVLKGQEIARREGNFELPIHSSVSGVVTGIEERTIYNGSKVKTVVIKNNMKEETIEKEVTDKINKYSKNDFISELKNGGIRGLGGADFPTYIKYDNNNLKYLVINAVECEPYITSDYMVMKHHYEEILECIDAIMSINKIEKAYIAIKGYNKEIIDLFNTVIGTYPNIIIKIVPNLYPMGWEKNLVRFLFNKEYDKLPSEVNVVINNVSTIYAIYEMLKYHRPITERVITISGDMVKRPINILAKIGTDINELLELADIKKRGSIIVSGGPMMGKLVDNDLVTSSSINSILVMKKNEDIPLVCLRCGKCSEVCPSKLSPVLIKDSINDVDRLKELEPNRCVECGLCSYICPAKINVRDYIIDAKKKVRGK